VYAIFDKEIASKMFGYRVLFTKKKMGKNVVSEPYAPQTNKPLTKYVNDIIGELTSTYIQIPRYHSKQRILIPIMDSEDERAYEPKEKDAAEKTERSSTNHSMT